MKLIDLHPKFADTDGVRTHLVFDCPKCQGKCGKLSIPIAGVSECQWKLDGDDFATLSLSPSVWVNPGGTNPSACDVHFFIRSGSIDIL